MGQPQVNIVLDTLGSKMNQFSRQHVGKAHGHRLHRVQDQRRRQAARPEAR